MSDATYAIISLLTAGTLLTIGVVTPVVVSNVIDSEVQNLVIVTSDTSPSFETLTNGNNSFNAFYFFDYQNPEEIEQGGRPNVTEIGPFVYQFKDYKFEVIFDLDQDTLSYYSQRYSTFQPDKSCEGYTSNSDYRCSPDKDVMLGEDYTVVSVNYALQLLIYQSGNQVVTVPNLGTYNVLDVFQLIIGDGPNCTFLNALGVNAVGSCEAPKVLLV
jgi:hypothetical protein